MSSVLLPAGFPCTVDEVIIPKRMDVGPLLRYSDVVIKEGN